jgi:hypothetical protein
MIGNYRYFIIIIYQKHRSFTERIIIILVIFTRHYRFPDKGLASLSKALVSFAPLTIIYFNI